MLHGTNEETAWKIAEAGFGRAFVLDEGWFGKGIYFTHSLDYSHFYAKDSPKGKIVILAMVIPGNSLPITEHPSPMNPLTYYGAACESGYQSHYTCGLLLLQFDQITKKKGKQISKFKSSELETWGNIWETHYQ